MYDLKPLIDALDSVIESAGSKLNELELQLLRNILDQLVKLDDKNDDDNDQKIEETVFELIKWLLIIMEYIKNTS